MTDSQKTKPTSREWLIFIFWVALSALVGGLMIWQVIDTNIVNRVDGFWINLRHFISTLSMLILMLLISVTAKTKRPY